MTDEQTPTPQQPAPPDGRARLREALRRPSSRGQVIVAVLLAVLGFAAVTQVKANDKDDQYVGARQGDLVQYINNLSLASQRTEADELKPGKRKLILTFDLPRGAYATMVVKRITNDSQSAE